MLISQHSTAPSTRLGGSADGRDTRALCTWSTPCRRADGQDLRRDIILPAEPSRGWRDVQRVDFLVENLIEALSPSDDGLTGGTSAKTATDTVTSSVPSLLACETVGRRRGP